MVGDGHSREGEGGQVQVLVRDNNVDQALKALKMITHPLSGFLTFVHGSTGSPFAPTPRYGIGNFLAIRIPGLTMPSAAEPRRGVVRSR